jgi:hypothetical protein
MFRIVIIALLSLLGACQSVSTGGTPDESSRNVLVPVGSRLVLHNTLTIPNEELGVYLQYGKVVRWQDLRRYAPYCVLERESPSEQPMTVKPDTFAITEVTRARRYYLPFFREAPLPLARAVPAASNMPLSSRRPRAGGNYSATVMAAILELRSSAQPDVRRFMCAASGTPEERFMPSIHEIREALGGFFTLELASP